MPNVSVVIPTYNRSKQIEHAVRSVLAQTHSNLEVIVVDDGSTDGTAQIIKECARKDPRIRLIEHGQRKGAQAARNTGILAARGKWIAFLDSDDQWFPDSLEVRLEMAARRGVHVVHSECYILDRGDAEPKQFGVPPMQGQVYKELLRFKQTFGPTFPSLLVSSEALADIGYLDETIVSFQEWDLAIRLARRYEFMFVPKPTFIYDRRHANAISKDLLRTAIGYEQVFTKHRWSILRYLGPRALASHYETAAFFYREANYKGKANLCLLSAILLWPFRPRAILKRAQRLLGWQCAR